MSGFPSRAARAAACSTEDTRSGVAALSANARADRAKATVSVDGLPLAAVRFSLGAATDASSAERAAACWMGEAASEGSLDEAVFDSVT